MEFRCFHCRQVFNEITGLEHFGKHTTDLPLCIQYQRSGSGGGLHDAYERVRRSFLAELDDVFCDLSQLVSGWKQTTPTDEWSEWDEQIRQKMAATHAKVLEARGVSRT